MSYPSEKKETEGNNIQSAFQIVQSPAHLYNLQKIQAQERMEGYKRYEEALDTFQKKLEEIQRRQEKNQVQFNGMFTSILRSSNKITQEVETIQKEVVSVSNKMTEAMASLDSGLEECNKKFGKEMNMVLTNLEKTYNKLEKKEAMELAGAVRDMANIIYNYAG